MYRKILWTAFGQGKWDGKLFACGRGKGGCMDGEWAACGRGKGVVWEKSGLPVDEVRGGVWKRVGSLARAMWCKIVNSRTTSKRQ